MYYIKHSVNLLFVQSKITELLLKVLEFNQNYSKILLHMNIGLLAWEKFRFVFAKMTVYYWWLLMFYAQKLKIVNFEISYVFIMSFCAP